MGAVSEEREGREARKEREMSKTMDAARIASLASALYDAMETHTRAGGGKFVRLKDDRPDWMADAVSDAHGQDIFPDDWRYAEIKDAAASIHNNDGDWETVADEVEADCYNIDRLRWLASHLERPAICDEAARELGFEYDGDSSDLLALIGLGQHYERRGIVQRLAAALEEHGPTE